MKRKAGSTWPRNLQSAEEKQYFCESSIYSIDNISFSTNGLTFLCTAYYGRLILWDKNTEKMIKTYLGHGLGVSSAVFNHDESQIISGSLDGTIKFWNID